MCGGICNDLFIANFLLSVTVKEVKNQSILGEDMNKSLVSCFFDSRCITNLFRHYFDNNAFMCYDLCFIVL